MKIKIRHRYTAALAAQLYVERAKQIDEVTHTFVDEDLRPAARQAALTALTASPIGYSSWGLLYAAPPDDKRPVRTAVDAWSEFSIDIADPSSDEISRDRALLDVERELVRAASAAPAIHAELERREQAEKAAQEAARSKAIEALLAAPLSVWLAQDSEKKWVLSSYSNRERLPNSLDELVKLDARLDARAKEAKAEADRLNTERVNELARNHDAVRALVAEHGTANQLERFDEDVLPDAELDALVSDVLFAKLSELPRYVPLTADDIPHSEDCSEPEAKFSSVTYDGSLDATQWVRLKAVRAVAPDGAKVEVRQHSGWCDDSGCDAGTVERMSIRVTVRFAGESYSRAYAI